MKITNSELFGRIQYLIGHRYQPVLIRHGEKRPIHGEWHNCMTSDRMLKAIQANPDAGIGILTRHNPAIDIDCLNPEIAQAARALAITRLHQLYKGKGLLSHIVERVGRAPKTLLLCYTDKPFRKVQSVVFRDENGLENRLEILGDGQQCVMFGIHPDTKREYHQPEDSILKVPAQFLPEIDKDWARRLVRDFEQLCRDSGLIADHTTPAKREQPDNVIAFPATDDQKQDIRLALLYIDADVDHDRWVQIGMALHLAYSGSAEGLEIFDEWSAQGDKHKDGEPEKRWKSFHIDAPHPVTISTIFAEAAKEGFNPAAPSVPAEPVAIDLDGSDEPDKHEEEQADEDDDDDDALMRPPGLLGELAEFYQSVMFVPNQAEYALAAAINTLSFATQNALTTPTGAGLNTLIFCVGRTGSGKDAALAAAMQGAVACDLAEQTIGDFTSGQAVVRALTEMGAVNLIKDEMGQFIGTKRDSVHTGTTITSLMTYATKARSTVGKKWAADPKRDLPVVTNPFLNVFSCTTPEVLAKATTSDALADGFMNRFLYFTPKDRGAMSGKHGTAAPMPEELRQKITAIVGFSRGEFKDKKDNDKPVIQPSWGAGAEELWTAYWVRNTVELEDEEKDMYGRAGWHSLVIATIVAIGRMSVDQIKKSKPVVVSASDVQYGIDLTDWSVKNMCEQVVNRFGETDFTSMCDRAEGYIRSVRKWKKDKKFGAVAKEGIMLRSLLVRLMRIKSYDLDSIVTHLVESERILPIKITIKSSRKHSIGYRAE